MTAKTKHITIGKRRVELTLTHEGRFFARWSPDIPKQITKIELDQFLKSRDELIQSMAHELEAGHVLDAYSRSEWETA
jgi:hypothetical protein